LILNLLLTGGLENTKNGLEFSHFSAMQIATSLADFLLDVTISGGFFRLSAGVAQPDNPIAINKESSSFIEHL